MAETGKAEADAEAEAEANAESIVEPVVIKRTLVLYDEFEDDGRPKLPLKVRTLVRLVRSV